MLTAAIFKRLALVFLCFYLASCSSIIEKQTSKFTDNLSSTVLSFEDPETVKAATPTFLILIDSMARHEDSSGKTQMAAAQMFGSFAGAFVTEPKRQKLLSNKAFHYAKSGSCKLEKDWCKLDSAPKDEFNTIIDSINEDNLDLAYAYAVAWLGYIQTHADDWAVVAQLAKAQQLLEKVASIDDTIDNAGPHLYLGSIASTLPPALGGKPEIAKQHFEKGIEITQGKSLLIKTEYARRYARSTFDKELHHQLLSEVIEADPIAGELTLMNAWAQQQAQILLDDEAEYFD